MQVNKSADALACVRELVLYLYPPEEIDREWDSETIEQVAFILQRHGWLRDIDEALEKGENTWNPTALVAATRPL